MEKELVSVIMPAYNAEKYISFAVESVIKQTYKNWELIVVNDCSFDKTKEIVENYITLDSRIKIVSLVTNQGVANARNIALNISNGDYIAFLDSDDIWHEEKINRQLEYIQNQKVDACCSDYSIINENGVLVKDRKVPKKIGFKDLLKENTVILSSVLIKKNSIGNVCFNPNCYHEDYLFWLELLKQNCIFVGLNLDLLCYRVHSGGRSFNKINAAKHRWIIYREFLNLNLMMTWFYFIQYALNGIRKYI